MKLNTLTKTLTLAIVIAGVNPAAATEMVVNGDFETGTLAGWTVSGSGSGTWLLNDGTLATPNPVRLVLAPLAGSYDAVSSQTGSSNALLSQPILLPGSISSATFSWLDYIHNAESRGFGPDPRQEIRVGIVDASNVFHPVWDTNPGDPNISGPNARSFDVTSLLQPLAGTSIQLLFDTQATTFYLSHTIDNVSLDVNSAATVPATGSTMLMFLLGVTGLQILRGRASRV